MRERTCQKIIGHKKRMQERNLGVEIKKKVQNVNKNNQEDEYRNYKYKKTTQERKQNCTVNARKKI